MRSTSLASNSLSCAPIALRLSAFFLSMALVVAAVNSVTDDCNTNAPHLRRADDGLDRPALPLLPAPGLLTRAALHRDDYHRRAHPRRCRPPSCLQQGRASRRAAAWRLRTQ